MKNDSKGEFTVDDMLQLIKEGNFQGRTIDAKTISANQITKLSKAGWKFVRMEPVDGILRCYFERT